MHLPGHDGQWFERVHVVPRTSNLGYILNNREVSVEVWNACRRGLSLVSAPVTGPDGVSILSEILEPLTFPEHFSPLQSRVYIALVSVVGEDQVDNLVTWNFASESFPVRTWRSSVGGSWCSPRSQTVTWESRMATSPR